MNQLATQHKHPLAAFADKYDIDPQEMAEVLKATCFRQRENVQVTNEQMVALMAVAQQHDLNPFLKQIYAFPDKSGGIVPVVGIDGWLKLINKHPQYDGMEIQYSDNWIRIDEHSKPCPEYMTATIYRKDRKHATPIREDLDECYKPPFKNSKTGYVSSGPWQSHPKRFLRHKTIIQAARVVFNITGIYDEDEAESIIEHEVNPDFKAPVEPIVRNESEAKQSQTENIVNELKSHKPISDDNIESKDINYSAHNDKKEEKTSDEKPKKMTVKQKNDLLRQIKESNSTVELIELVPELSKYEEQSTNMMELRSAWKTKKETLEDEKKNN